MTTNPKAAGVMGESVKYSQCPKCLSGRRTYRRMVHMDDGEFRRCLHLWHLDDKPVPSAQPHKKVATDEVSIKSQALAAVRSHYVNAPDNKWVEDHCPMELAFAIKMLAFLASSAAQVTELEKASGVFAEITVKQYDRITELESELAKSKEVK